MRRQRWAQAVGVGAMLVAALALSGDVLAGAPATGVSKRLPRAYPGAPPLVPHEVEERKGLCQECHATGEQGAPITPHPTRNHFCVQCHVEQDLTVKPFAPSATAR